MASGVHQFGAPWKFDGKGGDLTEAEAAFGASPRRAVHSFAILSKLYAVPTRYAACCVFARPLYRVFRKLPTVFTHPKISSRQAPLGQNQVVLRIAETTSV